MGNKQYLQLAVIVRGQVEVKAEVVKTHRPNLGRFLLVHLKTGPKENTGLRERHFFQNPWADAR